MIFVCILFGILTILFAALYFHEKQIVRSRYTKELEQAKNHIKKSTFGHTVEQLVPFMNNFNYNPADARFIGSPIDFIVFDGLNDGQLRKIIFIEVKSGKAILSNNEKTIQKCIFDGFVNFQIIRINEDE